MAEFIGGKPDTQLMEMLATVKELMAQGKSREEAIAIALKQAETPEVEVSDTETEEMPV